MQKLVTSKNTMPDKKKSEGGGGGPPAAKRPKDGGETSASSSPSVRGTSATIKRKASDAASSGDGLTYDPMHFIRSHSKNNDPADIQTQIWEVVFEPDPLNAERTTSRVATCGGNSICIIDVNTGTVLMKYKHKELK